MKNVTGKRSSQNMGNVFFILLFAIAALSSMVKDLDRMHELAARTVHLGSELLAAGVTTVDSKSLSPAGNACSSEAPAQAKAADEFRWTGRVATGQAIEINRRSN